MAWYTARGVRGSKRARERERGRIDAIRGPCYEYQVRVGFTIFNIGSVHTIANSSKAAELLCVWCRCLLDVGDQRMSRLNVYPEIVIFRHRFRSPRTQLGQ